MCTGSSESGSGTGSNNENNLSTTFTEHISSTITAKEYRINQINERMYSGNDVPRELMDELQYHKGGLDVYQSFQNNPITTQRLQERLDDRITVRDNMKTSEYTNGQIAALEDLLQRIE